MVKGNTCMGMEAIIMGIGSKERCKESGSSMILMGIYNMRENGKMITIMEKEPFMGWAM